MQRNIADNSERTKLFGKHDDSLLSVAVFGCDAMIDENQ